MSVIVDIRKILTFSHILIHSHAGLDGKKATKNVSFLTTFTKRKVAWDTTIFYTYKIDKSS